MATIPQDAFYATGRRKTSVARVWLFPGDGNIKINDRDIEGYFGRATSRMVLRQPLELTETTARYNIVANVRGGGLQSQAEAVRHAVARALCSVNETFRTPLKRAGYLTRDARKKERKKPGQPGARKRYQFSKR